MIGGYGVFYNEKMFCRINFAGETFPKANEQIKSKIEGSGGHAYGRIPYFSVPDYRLNDVDQLLIWTKESIEISK